MEEVEGGAVERLLGDDGLPALDPRQDGRGDGRHAGSEQVPLDQLFGRRLRVGAQQVQPLQGGVLAHQLVGVGVVVAGVDISLLSPRKGAAAGVDIGEAEGGGLVDRGDGGVQRVTALGDVVHQRADPLFGFSSIGLTFLILHNPSRPHRLTPMTVLAWKARM